MAGSGDNRFINGNTNLSNQFIFGIDDALIAAIAGPVLQILPQLMNSANQAKLQNKAATNKLITDLVADTNRRVMLQDFLSKQPATPGNNIDLNQLLQLLQQVPTANANQVVATPPNANNTPTVTPAPNSETKSLSFSKYTRTLSTKTILSFETAAKISISGKDYAVYNRNSDIKLKLKLNVVEPAPKNPLPKAIIKFCFKDNSNKKVLEKVFKEKNIAPNTPLEFNFTSTETKVIPGNTPVNVYAEMKWLTSQNKEHSTFGYSDIILAGDYIYKEQGEGLIGEKELTDMNIYRSFWNKVWESPVLDKIKSDSEGMKKSLWELNANLKYSFAYSAENQSNGLMETKMLVGEKDPDSLKETVDGRMKAGIEISISELNKLCALWDKQPVLTPEKLNALKTEPFMKNNASELIYNIKLKGRANERGIVWVVPILKLFNFTLNKIKSIDQWGQVTEVEEEKIQFPLPVSARILGIKTA
jgi:hypothetical protein